MDPSTIHRCADQRPESRNLYSAGADRAAMYGRLEVAKYLAAHGLLPSPDCLRYVVGNGYADVLDHLASIEIFPTVADLDFAATHTPG